MNHSKSKTLIKKPDTIKPVVKKPDTIKPVVKKPDTIKPVVKKPDTIKPVIKKPDTIKPVIKKENTLMTRRGSIKVIDYDYTGHRKEIIITKEKSESKYEDDDKYEYKCVKLNKPSELSNIILTKDFLRSIFI